MAVTPHLSHLMVLLFLGAGFGTIVGFFASLYGVLRKAKLASKIGTSLMVACAGGYGSILLGVGLASPNKVLPMGSWKYFCEVDCHVAYAIASAQSAATLGTETTLNQARGEYIVVRLKTWFDEETIAKFRGDAPLTPNPRHVALVDDDGRRFLPAQLNPGTLGVSAPLIQPLRPGESYVTSFAFDVPKGAHGLRLLIGDDDPMSTLIIDHEESPFHGKIYLSLGLSPEAAFRARP